MVYSFGNELKNEIQGWSLLVCFTVQYKWLLHEHCDPLRAQLNYFILWSISSMFCFCHINRPPKREEKNNNYHILSAISWDPKLLNCSLADKIIMVLFLRFIFIIFQTMIDNPATLTYWFFRLPITLVVFLFFLPNLIKCNKLQPKGK